jgi:hypothetical protein
MKDIVNEAASVSSIARCPTCGTPPAGRYCAECGQLFRTKRLSLGRIAADALSNLTDVERGLPHTVRNLFLQPGAVVRSYVNGATGRITGPAKYLVICAAVGAVAYLQLGWLNTAPDRAAGGIASFAREHLSVVLIARVPLASLVSWLLFRRAGYNLAEHLVFNSYATAQSLLILAATSPLPLVGGISMEAYAFVLVGSAFAYYAWAAVDFFRMNVYRDILRAGVIQALVMLTYALLLGFGTGAL